MSMRTVRRAVLYGSTAALALAAFAAPVAAFAQTAEYSFNIPAQDLATALRAFGRTARQQVVFDSQLTQGKSSTSVVGTYSADDGLRRLLAGTGLTVRRGASGVLVVSGPQGEGGASPDNQAT